MSQPQQQPDPPEDHAANTAGKNDREITMLSHSSFYRKSILAIIYECESRKAICNIHSTRNLHLYFCCIVRSYIEDFNPFEI